MVVGKTTDANCIRGLVLISFAASRVQPRSPTIIAAMKSFTLATVLFVVTIVALVLSNVLAWRETAATHSDFERIRSEYGVIDRSNSSKTFVKRFVNKDYRIASATGRHGAESFRIVPADGVRYVLHLSEVDNPKNYAYPAIEDLTPSETNALDDWRPGAVVSCVVSRKGQAPRVLVAADSDTVIDFQSSSSWNALTSTSESWMGLGVGQREYEPYERIRLYWWHAEGVKRGFMLWLEPYDQWKRREKEAKSIKQNSEDPREQVAP